MNRLPMSAAASSLLRALIARAGVPRERILLTDAHSIDWRSLTFTGERHQLGLRVPGPDSRAIVERMCAGLEEAACECYNIVRAEFEALAQQPR